MNHFRLSHDIAGRSIRTALASLGLLFLAASGSLFLASALSACTITASTQIPLPTAKVPSLFEVKGAIDLWESSANPNYFISVEETNNTGTHLYRVVIVDGKIQAAQQLEKVDGAWQQPVALDPVTAEQYTVDALLERILRDVNGEGAAPLNMYVVFDNVSGYPTLVDAKAVQSYAPDGRINLNREHSYVLTAAVEVLIEDSFGVNKIPILTLSRSGGERASCSTLRIFTDGASIYSDNCRQILLQLRPPQDSFARLETLSAELAGITESRTLDDEVLDLTLVGTGSGAPGQETVDEIWELAFDLDALLSRPVGEGITLLLRKGDGLVGFDLRSNAEQPATLPLVPPLHGAIVDLAGRLLIYSDGSGLNWLDAVSGETGTYSSNSADQWTVPVAVTGDGRVVLNRFSSGTESAEWGWVSLDDRAWHALPDVGSCIESVGASPMDGRLAVTTGAGDGCGSEAAVWVMDLAANSADPIVTNFSDVAAAGWSADGSWLAFSANPPGEEEVEQVYLVRPDGSELTMLTDHAVGAVTGLVWNPSGDTLIYGLAGAAEPESGLHEIDPGTGEIVKTLPGENLTPIGFDATGEFLAFHNGSNLSVWVISFGQVQPAVQGGAGDAFIGFLGSGD